MVNPGHWSGISEFKRLAPPSFKGSIEPLEAEKWLQDMEKVFAAMIVMETEKVSYAIRKCLRLVADGEEAK